MRRAVAWRWPLVVVLAAVPGRPDYWPTAGWRTAPPAASAGADGYGYQWWVGAERGHPSFQAVGYGGRFVQVVPDLDLVVVITSDAASRRWDAANLVGEAIVPAVTG